MNKQSGYSRLSRVQLVNPRGRSLTGVQPIPGTIVNIGSVVGGKQRRNQSEQSQLPLVASLSTSLFFFCLLRLSLIHSTDDLKDLLSQEFCYIFQETQDFNVLLFFKFVGLFKNSNICYLIFSHCLLNFVQFLHHFLIFPI